MVHQYQRSFWPLKHSSYPSNECIVSIKRKGPFITIFLSPSHKLHVDFYNLFFFHCNGISSWFGAASTASLHRKMGVIVLDAKASLNRRGQSHSHTQAKQPHHTRTALSPYSQKSDQEAWLHLLANKVRGASHAKDTSSGSHGEAAWPCLQAFSSRCCAGE